MDWGWIARNLPMIWDETYLHVVQSLIPLVVGTVVSIPLGYWAHSSKPARAILLTITDIFYTIPGLALLVLLPLTLGFAILSPLGLEIALTVYAIALLVRSAADGFGSVSRDVVNSATAVGYGGFRRFWTIQLPLATPVVIAGLRVASVSTVSLATIGAITGQSNLGTLFLDGFNRSFPTEIFVGIILVLILAAIFDTVIALAGRALTPWRRAGAVSRRRASSKAVSA